MSEADNLLNYMPHAVRSGSVNEWERKFCASMIARQNRKAFRPTEKQIKTMAAIVEKFKADMFRDDSPLIEGEGNV